MSKNPNPQGKGTSPVLATLESQRSQLATVPPKQIDQVTTELFTSLFVLDSEFRFKPVPGRVCYLYRRDGGYWLGLTPPDMLGEAVAGRFIGTCVLQRDLTWTLALADDVAADERFMAWLSRRRAAFEQALAGAERLDDVLPRYESHLPFYRRAAAFAVAHSLGRSMSAAGIAGLSYDAALGRLARPSSSDDRVS
ncbi:DUF2452 domain-containing protein [Salinisphaera sp. T31B1]|uniref:DUF2452 domain-containing protein n=1 Tax=Salinisphaera sp. T31B1 TaxID=727963 RepID=UPI003341D479